MNYIDLGLPSGTKWADCNVGATSPSEKGLSYTFVEAVAASKYMGAWIPTKKDFEELLDHCKWKYIKWENICGQLIIGKNGNSIFFPIGDEDVWLSTPSEDGPGNEMYSIFVDANCGDDGSSWVPRDIMESCSLRMVLK